MTKKEYQKYNKEVKDKYGNRISPGDTVVIHDGYYNNIHIGTVHHFAEITVIVECHDSKWGSYLQQRYPDRIIKVRDKDSNEDFIDNWPKKKENK